ncbi:glutathione S-transferase family protein [Pseudomonadota bacterium]
MGLLIDGVWHDQWYDTKSTGGKFVRSESQFRNWIMPNGETGPSGEGGFAPETGRYHLYVSPACPWSHRAILFRKLKALDDVISMSVLSPNMLDHGWAFSGELNSGHDDLYNASYMHELYTRAKSQYTGRVTVPVLWDKKKETIVSNESSEIVRMFNSAFNNITGNTDDYCPESLRAEQNEINEFIYHNVNNGVYRCGFATSQQAYEEAYEQLFSALDVLEERLDTQRYLVGGQITQADWRLYVTLIRFDAVYYSHFKCNRNQLKEFHNLSNYLRELYQYPGAAETTNMAHIKQHYYYSQTSINPAQIVPKGPLLDFNAPHNRNTRF